MSFFNIDQALINSVLEVLPDANIEWPNHALPSGSKGDLWYKVSFISGTSNAATLGSNGEDNHPGVLQIDVNVPVNSGTGVLNQEIDKLYEFYQAGKGLLFNGQTVKILVGSTSPIREVSGFARRSFSVNYYARTVRNQ